MRKRILGSLAVVAAGAGLSFGQGPGPVDLPPGAGGPGMMMPGGPIGPGGPMGPGGPFGPGGPGGPGGPDTGLMLRDGRSIIPPPVVGGMLNPAEFGPPMPGPDQGGGGLGLWEQNGPPTFWLGFDYLMWWQKGQSLPPLVTTGEGFANTGILGGPSTTLLLGNQSANMGLADGLRTWFGFYTDDEKRTGLEFGFFLMESRGFGRNFKSSNDLGLPLLAIPFVDSITGGNQSYLVSQPTNQIGSINFSTQSQAYNIEGNCVFNLYRPDPASGNGLDFLIGMRFFSLEERLRLATSTQDIGGVGLNFAGGVATGNPVVSTNDQIRTFNEFYGLNLGLRGDHNYGRIYWGWSAKFAAGYLNSYSDVAGASSLGFAGTNSLSIAPGGRFIEPADIGRHRDGQFAILPEGAFNIGYQLTPKIRLQAGYTFMWINRVIRPADILDQKVNGPSLPTDARFGTVPARTFNHDLTPNSDYWLQGINFGIQVGF